MDTLNKLVGKKARRVTFSVQNGEKNYLLLSIIELLLEDMQDYSDIVGVDNAKTDEYSKKKEGEGERIIMTVDCIELSAEFLNNPHDNYEIDNRKYICNWLKSHWMPALDSPPYILRCANQDDLTTIEELIPQRTSSKGLHAYVSKGNGNVEMLLNNSELIEDLRMVSEAHYGLNLADYLDCLGNIYIIQYNKQFKNIEIRKSKNGNGIFVNIHFRKDADEKVKIRITSKNSIGLINFEVDDYIEKTSFHKLIKLPSDPEIIDIKLFDLQDNLIFCECDIHFISKIVVQQRIAEQCIELVHKDKNGESETERVEKCYSQNFEIKDEGQKEDLLKQIQLNHAYRKLEKSLDFVLLIGDPTQKDKNIIKGRNIIQRILNKANAQCIIYDPYFSIHDLEKYIFKIPTSNIVIKILSSKEHIAKNSECRKAIAKQIFDSIKRYRDRTRTIVEFKLIEGAYPPHDRFIIVDDEVWLLGSSFNQFGTRTTTIIKLNPGAAREACFVINKLWNNTDKTKSIEEYAADKS